MHPSERLRSLRSASTLAKAFYLAAAWLVFGLVRIGVAYSVRGARGRTAAVDEFVFVTVILVFVAPSLWLATGLERRFKGRFPVWGTFMALFVTLVPSLILGVWAAIAVAKALF